MMIEKYDEMIYKLPSELETGDVLSTGEIVQKVDNYGCTSYNDVNWAWCMEFTDGVFVEVIGKVIE